MNDKQIKNVLCGLLHDIGKVLYRAGDGRNHSESGYDFLKNELDIVDTEILNSVRYHHYGPLSKANIGDDSLAYITYIADNIASASDRRESDTGEPGFAINTPLESIFNLLNNNTNKKYYLPYKPDEKDRINYPQAEKHTFDGSFYSSIKENLYEVLKKAFDFNNPNYINSLLEIMEASLTYVPSSTSKNEVADISLFDHVKLTAALASCIYEYLEENNIKNYKNELFENSVKFYDKKSFLMYSIDISGIQDFIYTINAEGALKTLRARSFYLEVFMETIIDEILVGLNLSRTNLIYSGGGHCYIILPNTEKTKNIIDDFEIKVNDWLLDNFRTKLYIAGGYAECSSNDLRNKIDGSYAEIFSTMSRIISRKKLARYSTEAIIKLNNSKRKSYLRECKVCKSLDDVDNENRCSFCSALIKISPDIMDKPFFSVVNGGGEGLKLPFNRYLVADKEEEIARRMNNDPNYIRSYGKNKIYVGKDITTKLWVGSYHSEDRTDKLAEMAEGIDRIVVLRADVDNLGHAFVHGFERKNAGAKFVTLSRTAALSRQLSLFFKKHINYILSNGVFSLGKENKKRNALIVYSGGDDVFIVGSWNDAIALSVDISNEFRKFTDNTLSISAGVGIYDSSFPISISAKEVEMLEEASKNYPDKSNPTKNAITLFDESGTYTWTDFEKRVVGEKLTALKKFFANTEDHGKSFLYNILCYIRHCDDKINVARYAYLLSRMQPKNTDDKEQTENYKIFSQKLYDWIKNPEDRKELVTAIYLYAYLKRDKKNGENEE